MKSGLSIRIVLSVLLTVAVTLSAGFYFIIQEEKKDVLQNMKEEACTLATIIANNLSKSLKRVKEERELLQSLAVQIHKHEKLVWVEIFNRDGIIVAHTNKNLIGALPNPKHLEYVKRVVNSGEIIEEEEYDRKRLVKFVPVYFNNDEQRNIVGVMELAIGMEAGMKKAIERSYALTDMYKNIAGRILLELNNAQDSIQLMAEEAGETERVMWVEVFDKEAKIIAHTEKSRVGQKPLPIHEEYVRKVFQTGEVVEEEDFERDRFNRFVPYFAGSEKGHKDIAGVIELVMDMRPIMERLEALKTRMALIVLSLIVVIVGALLFMLRKLVIKPVRELTRATRDMAEGDMERQVRITSKHELGELGDAFNNMAVNLNKSQTDLLEAKAKAEEGSRAKSEFLASMSHEIRTPMNIIIGMTDVLKGTKLASEQEMCLNKLAKAGDNLVELINNILDLSKIEANKFEMEEAEFNIERLLSEVESFIGVMAREKGLKLSYHIEPDVPPNVVGDLSCLRQVLYNLVSNAIKFTDNGRIDINIRKTGINEGRVELECYIKDTGIGIQEDKLNIIFERFTQADSSTTRKFGGSGLGTTISKRLIEMMGGMIWAESKVGEGSTFYFTVQMKIAVEEAKETFDEEKSILWKQPLRILLVEDSEDNLMLMEMYLSKTPHIVDIAENGKVAVEKFQSGGYDIILMDMEMPVMDGYTATKEIRQWETKEKKKSIPIVALTAHALKEHEQRSFDVGCTAHITKPIKKQEFLEAIYEYVNK